MSFQTPHLHLFNGRYFNIFSFFVTIKIVFLLDYLRLFSLAINQLVLFLINHSRIDPRAKGHLLSKSHCWQDISLSLSNQPAQPQKQYFNDKEKKQILTLEKL